MIDAYVLDALRTPRGKGRAGGALASIPPVRLAAGLIEELTRRHVVDRVDDVVLGCATQAGEQGTNVARLAALLAGLDRVSGATVSRFCCSGLDAIITAAARVATPYESVVIAGGVESMSRAPMFSDRGPWFSDRSIAEATGFVHMAVSADLLATRAGLTKDALDAYAIESHRRARRAADEGWPKSLVPTAGLDRDEGPRALDPDEVAERAPAFADLYDDDARRRIAAHHGDLAVRPLHTGRTAPQLADAASAVLVASADAAERLGVAPRARIAGWAQLAATPAFSLGGNVDACRLAVERAGWSIADVDLFEVNESFAAVPLAFMATLDVGPDRLDVDGGAIAAGHPLGATGGILVSSLLDALERLGGRRGVASVCGAAGVATAIALERSEGSGSPPRA